MIRISALLIATACAATLAAEPTIIGPLAMRAGEVVEIDVYNPSDSTTGGGVDLLDAAMIAAPWSKISFASPNRARPTTSRAPNKARPQRMRNSQSMVKEIRLLRWEQSP